MKKDEGEGVCVGRGACGASALAIKKWCKQNTSSRTCAPRAATCAAARPTKHGRGRYTKPFDNLERAESGSSARGGARRGAPPDGGICAGRAFQVHARTVQPCERRGRGCPSSVYTTLKDAGKMRLRAEGAAGHVVALDRCTLAGLQACSVPASRAAPASNAARPVCVGARRVARRAAGRPAQTHTL